MNRQEEIKKASMIIADGQVSSENFVKGAEWADKTMIEKAVKWLEENITNDPTRGLMAKYGRCVTHGELLRDFKKAMEE